MHDAGPPRMHILRDQLASNPPQQGSGALRSPTSTQGLRLRLCGMISLGGSWCSILCVCAGIDHLQQRQDPCGGQDVESRSVHEGRERRPAAAATRQTLPV